MTDQLKFDFGELPRPPRPKLAERLFFALFPEFSTAEILESVARSLRNASGLTGKLLQTDRFHLTLHHVRDDTRLQERYVFASRLAAQAVSIPQFEVTFDRAKSFHSAPKRKRPFVLLGGSTALTRLHGALGAAMLKQGLKGFEHFVPHMTLLYDDRLLPSRPVEPITWSVKEFVLVHSWRGLTRYDVLGRWALRGC